MKKIVGLFIGLFLIVSCSSDDFPNNSEVFIKEYNPLFMFYDVALPQNVLVKLEYDSNNKVSKRIGGMILLPYNSTFSNEIYDEVSYRNDEIVVGKKTTSTEFQVDKFIRTYKLNNGRIVGKTIDRGQSKNQVYTFDYDSSNRISKMENKKVFSSDESYFYYNTKNNLDSIVTKKHYINPQNQKKYLGKTVHVFSNYDTASNPLKQFIFFEETFFRSLSENNFAKYIKLTFDENNENTSSQIVEWQLDYDKNGNVDFSRYN